MARDIGSGPYLIMLMDQSSQGTSLGEFPLFKAPLSGVSIHYSILYVLINES